MESVPAPTILLLLGRKPQAVAASREIRKQADRLPSVTRGWHTQLLDYDCDLLTAEELLAAAGRSRQSLCEAHYRIALHCLAEGDRSGAREHFRRCIAKNFFILLPYYWSRAFLGRMDEDPAWPLWIPLRE